MNRVIINADDFGLSPGVSRGILRAFREGVLTSTTMLANMDDPKAIGPAMAVALLTTLYGAIIANAMCGPIAAKLKLRAGEEANVKNLVIDALLAIQGGQNPRVIDSMLRTYLPEGKRDVTEAADA